MLAILIARACAALTAVSVSHEGGEVALASVADTMARRTVEVSAAGVPPGFTHGHARVAPHLPVPTPPNTATVTRGAFITPVAASMVLAALLGVVATGLSISPKA